MAVNESTPVDGNLADRAKPSDRYVRYLVLASALVLGLFVLASSIDKALHWNEFLKVLGNYPFVPAGFQTLVAFPAVLLELYVGISLLIPATRQNALLYASGLFLVFTIAIVSLYSLKEGAPCGCMFSFGSTKADIPHIIQNLSFSVLCFCLWLLSGNKFQRKRSTTENSQGEPVITDVGL